MKYLTLLLLPFSVLGAGPQPAPVVPATQAEVNAGTETRKYVSPATLNTYALSSPTNGLNFTASSNLSLAISSTNNTTGYAAKLVSGASITNTALQSPNLQGQRTNGVWVTYPADVNGNTPMTNLVTGEGVIISHDGNLSNGSLSQEQLVASLLGTNRIYWVNASTGDDSYVGSSNYPLKTIEFALDSSSSNDVVMLQAGNYSITNVRVLKSGVALAGIGTNSVSVKCYVPLPTNGPAIHLSDDCYIYGISFNCANSNQYNAALGGYGGNYATETKSTHLRSVVESVVVVGETDCYYDRNTNNNTTTFVSCLLTSRWDAVVIDSATNFVTDYVQCSLKTVGTNSIPGVGNNKHCFFAQAGGGLNRFYGCDFECSGTAGYITAWPATGVPKCYLYSCTWNTNSESVDGKEFYGSGYWPTNFASQLIFYGGTTLDTNRVFSLPAYDPEDIDNNFPFYMTYYQTNSTPWPSQVDPMIVVSQNKGRQKVRAILGLP